MNIALIGTRTGHGHISVLNAIKTKLSKAGVNLFVEKDFPEEKLSGYDFLSNFYNYLLGSSLELSNKFTEMLIHARSDKDNKFISQSQGAIIQYIESNKIDIVVSFAPFLNYALYNATKKISRKVQLTTVFTDPFLPYMVGFDCPFFDYYYVSDESVKSDLISKGVDENRIFNYGFPVAESYFLKYSQDDISRIKDSFGLENQRKTIICNCGAEGNPLFLKYVNPILSLHEYIQCVFICGKNRFLYSSVKKIISNSIHNNIILTGFIDNMPDLLKISDLMITKPGANIVFESLHSNVPLFIDITSGVLYQERGIVNFIESKNLGFINRFSSQNLYHLSKIIAESMLLDNYKTNIENLQLVDSAMMISNHIVSLINNI